MISATALSWLVGVALVVTVAAPLLLIGLFVRDARRGELW